MKSEADLKENKKSGPFFYIPRCQFQNDIYWYLILLVKVSVSKEELPDLTEKHPLAQLPHEEKTNLPLSFNEILYYRIKNTVTYEICF